ncbi:hypothetical protein N7448_000267 [Penicillium atrosanguineum]|nr:hypothetical protein N7448_000267 [Penicillium atrosanguineum]
MDEIDVATMKHEMGDAPVKDNPHYLFTYGYSFGRFRLLEFCNGTSTPYSLYNWEVGFHIISLIVARLLALQQHTLVSFSIRLCARLKATSGAFPLSGAIRREKPVH